MSAGTQSAKWNSKWLSHPAFISLLIVMLVFVVTLVLWHTGRLQFLEFHSYDFFIRHQKRAASTGPIVLVELTEKDIHDPTLDWPIYDDKLAELLRILETDKPAVIGLDIWRDIPVPKSGVGLPQFNEVLEKNSNIVAIFTLPPPLGSGIAAPAVLRSNSDRIAFNDNFILDANGDKIIPTVRRSALFASMPSGESFDSLPFRLALIYLQGKGISPQPDPKDPQAMLLGKARLRQFESNDGAYVGASADVFQMLLDFKCPDNFTRFSIVDILSGKAPVGTMRDKIVIVGLHSQSVFDERVTPINPRHPGFELQAGTVNQLLRMSLEGEEPMRFWSDRMKDAWLGFWCLVGGSIGYSMRSWWKFSLAAVACLGALTGIVWLTFSNGLWIPAVAPVIGFVPAMALVVAYLSAHERSMRNVLMNLYSRHVSKELAESVWENRDAFLDGRHPVAQKLVVTALFTDLKGFSTISEQMSPTLLYEWLSGYLSAMTHVIQGADAVLKQFAGDGILAFFGVPVPRTTLAEQSQDAVAAVRCALAMGRHLVELNKEWEKAGLPVVSMRAGIYTGEVAAGSIGNDDRFEYAVLGDAVNTASRLESYDKSLADPDTLPNRCRILIGASTHALLGDKFISREIGLLEVKGKANKVPVFQILEERTVAATAQAETAAESVAAK